MDVKKYLSGRDVRLYIEHGEKLFIGGFETISPVFGIDISISDKSETEIAKEIEDATAVVRLLWEQQALEALRNVLDRRAKVEAEGKTLAQETAKYYKQRLIS